MKDQQIENIREINLKRIDLLDRQIEKRLKAAYQQLNEIAGLRAYRRSIKRKLNKLE
jgi:hypothetical protein